MTPGDPPSPLQPDLVRGLWLSISVDVDQDSCLAIARDPVLLAALGLVWQSKLHVLAALLDGPVEPTVELLKL